VLRHVGRSVGVDDTMRAHHTHQNVIPSTVRQPAIPIAPSKDFARHRPARW
jgi:hypothetical protein